MHVIHVASHVLAEPINVDNYVVLDEQKLAQGLIFVARFGKARVDFPGEGRKKLHVVGAITPKTFFALLIRTLLPHTRLISVLVETQVGFNSYNLFCDDCDKRRAACDLQPNNKVFTLWIEHTVHQGGFSLDRNFGSGSQLVVNIGFGEEVPSPCQAVVSVIPDVEVRDSRCQGRKMRNRRRQGR